MTRAHLYRRIGDSEGNTVPNSKVTVYEPGTSTLIGQPLYTQPLGSPARTNPFVTSDGFVEFYLDTPQSVKIGTSVQGGPETFVDNLASDVDPQTVVQADQRFTISGAPQNGYFLRAGAPGTASWSDSGDLVNSKPTALNQIYDYDFSGQDMQDLSVTDAQGQLVTPIFVDVTADTKPGGWSFFTGAVQLPGPGRVKITVPTSDWVERGTVIFLYKVVSSNGGVGAAMLHVRVDDDLLFVETPVTADLINTWAVGYLDEIPAGTHVISFEHRPGTDSASAVLLGPVWLQYGGNIPAHDHPGTAEASVRLGTGAEAAYAGATAIGSAAKALGINATAYGYDARAESGGFAGGSGTRAGTDAVAVGSKATSAGHTGGIAIGKSAAATADYGVAVGPSALARGTGAVAVGSGAQTGDTGAPVAVGAGAGALANNSVAIGPGAFVDTAHAYSIAIGKDVATTAAHQARIGDTATTVVVPGSFRQVGGSGRFAGAGASLGFYGSAGTTKPTITGSRGGNATVAALLTALAGLGLITDSSTI